MSGTRRAGIALLVVGAVLLVGAVLVWAVLVPSLKKYPTDLNTAEDGELVYEGTFRVYLNPATGQQFEQPLELPLTIERTLVSEEISGDDVVGVSETIVTNAPPIVTDSVQDHYYVMDRSSLENVTDDRAWSFTEDNVVDRGGAFRLNLAFDTNVDDSPYPYYNNDSETTDEIVAADEDVEASVEGLDTLRFQIVADGIEMSDAYMDFLSESNVPESLTAEQFLALASGAGLDVQAFLGTLPPEQAQGLQALLADGVPLVYTQDVDGEALVAPETGTVVSLGPVNQTLQASLDPEFVDSIGAALGNINSPVAQAAAGALGTLGATPFNIFEYQYTQTPESVAASADLVGDTISQLNLIQRWIPIGLLVLGGIAIVAGILLYARGGTSGADVAPLTAGGASAGIGDESGPAAEAAATDTSAPSTEKAPSGDGSPGDASPGTNEAGGDTSGPGGSESPETGSAG